MIGDPVIRLCLKVQPTEFGYAARCAEALRASVDWLNEFGAAPQNLGVARKFNIELAGRPEAFRTSDGTAVTVRGLNNRRYNLANAALQVTIIGDG